MLPELMSLRDKLPPGMSPDLVESSNFLWDTAFDVLFTDDGVKSGWKAQLALSNVDSPVRGLHGQRTASLAQILFFGTSSKLWRSVALAAAVDVSSQAYTFNVDATGTELASHWLFQNFGEWVLATNGKQQIQIYKTGPTFAALTQTAGVMPFTFAKSLEKLGPFVLAFNTSNAPNEVWWCSADDVHDWIPTANNSAGEFIIRDLESEIVATCRLGERVAIFASDSMHVCSFIGAPNYFGFQKVLSGIGAVSLKSVVSVGRVIYGLGPQGFFMTDGTQVEYIDMPKIRDFFFGRVTLAQISKTTAYHNEAMNRVEWGYATTNNTVREAIAYDYRLKAWSIITSAFTIGLEREVFQYPLVAPGGSFGGDIYAIGVGTNRNAVLTSKALDFGSPQHGKFVSHVYLNYNGMCTLEIGHHDKLDGTVTWETAQTLDGSNDPIRVGITARYFRVRISGTSDFRVGGIVFYGRAGGAHK